MARTPRWWRALPTWAQALWLATWLPGAVAHELTHALVASPWASTTLDWDEIACEFAWDGDHYLARSAAYIAPLVVGSALTVGVWLTVLGRPAGVVEVAIAAYVYVNLGIYTIASAVDLHRCGVYLVAWYRTRPTANTETNA
jgi:hypothetical protein